MRMAHGAVCLNVRSLAGGTVWERLGSVALLEEVCHWGWAFMFQKIHVIPSYLHIPLSISVSGLWVRCKLSANVGYPSVCCEYVLLPLDNKEAALDYGRAE